VLVSFVSRRTIADKLLHSKKFRDSYVLENIKRIIPFQIRTMRDERKWSQAVAGKAIGKPQNVLSRLESPAYGRLTLQTLLEIARGYDTGLLIKFVPFSRLVAEYDDVSLPALSAKSVSDEEEAQALKEWAAHEPVAVEPVSMTSPARAAARRGLSKSELGEGVNAQLEGSLSGSDLRIGMQDPAVPSIDEYRRGRPASVGTLLNQGGAENKPIENPLYILSLAGGTR
jgi:transcriptional regulator with XRE-family HTH domain